MKTWRFGLAAVCVAAAVGCWFENNRQSQPPTAPLGGVVAAAIAPADSWRKAQVNTHPRTLPDVPAVQVTRPSLPSGPFGANIAQLQERADGGDADAAAAMLAGVRRCLYYVPPADTAEIEQRAQDNTVFQLGLTDQVVAQLRQKIDSAGGDATQIRGPETKPLFAANLTNETRRAAECAGAGAIGRSDVLHWLSRATDLGDLEAQLEYWREAFNAPEVPLGDLHKVRGRGVQGLHRALDDGDWRALAAISELLEQGYLARPDPAMAYAYGYAALQDCSDYRYQSDDEIREREDERYEHNSKMFANAASCREVASNGCSPERWRDDAIAAAREQRDRCTALSPRTIETRLDWARLALERGD